MGIAIKAEQVGRKFYNRWLFRGLNFHLARQQCNWERDSERTGQLHPRQHHRKRRRKQNPSFTFLGKRFERQDVELLTERGLQIVGYTETKIKVRIMYSELQLPDK